MNADHINDLATHTCIASFAVGHVLGLLAVKAVVDAAVGPLPWSRFPMPEHNPSAPRPSSGSQHGADP